MNNIESGLFKFGLWAFGIMFSAIFLMVSLTYKSQLDTADFLRNHAITQSQTEEYTIRRLSVDSVNIIKLQSENYDLKMCIKRISPEVYKSIFLDTFEAFYPKQEAILPEEKYHLKPE